MEFVSFDFNRFVAFRYFGIPKATNTVPERKKKLTSAQLFSSEYELAKTKVFNKCKSVFDINTFNL